MSIGVESGTPPGGGLLCCFDNNLSGRGSEAPGGGFGATISGGMDKGGIMSEPVRVDTEGRSAGKMAGARRWRILTMLLVSLLLLGFSFASYYRYSTGPALQRVCRVYGLQCVETLNTRNAWHGLFGWFAVVLALGAGVCVVARLLAAAADRVLMGMAWLLYALATSCLLAALVVVPNGSGSIDARARKVGVRYSDLVVNHHAWGFWVSLALAILGLGCATAESVAIIGRR